MQLSMNFDTPARARTTDPQTSHDAAAKVSVADSHRLVLDYLRSQRVARTSFDAADALAGSCSPSRVRGALKELERLGKVRRYSGAGVSNYGNKCDLWGAV
jgi:hypothetical protein